MLFFLLKKQKYLTVKLYLYFQKNINRIHLLIVLVGPTNN